MLHIFPIHGSIFQQNTGKDFSSCVGDAEKAKDLGAAVKLKNYDAYRKIFVTDKGEPRKRFATQEVFKIYPEGREFVDEETSRVLDFDNRLAAIKLFESTKAVVLLAEELLDGYSKYKELHSKAD